MPSSSTVTYGKSTSYTIFDTTVVDGWYPIAEWYLSKTDTIRRPKPQVSDFFASYTPRKVVELRRYGNIVSCEYPPGDVLKSTSGPASSFIGAPRPANEPVPDWLALDQKLRAKIKAEKVNLSNALAEARQTANLLLDVSRDVLKVYRSIRKGRAFADFIRLLQRPRNRTERAIANRVLQYNFGIKPLLQDVHDAAAAYLARVRLGVYRVVSTGQDQKQSYSYSANDGVSGTSEVFLQARAHARYRIDSWTLSSLSSYGITNPAVTLWEITPWSFVVDWLIDVSGFLEQLDATVGISDLRVHRGYRKMWTFNVSVAKSPPDVDRRKWSPGPPVRYGIETTTERMNSGTYLGINYPRIEKDPFKLNRVINSLSLYSQKRKSL